MDNFRAADYLKLSWLQTNINDVRVADTRNGNSTLLDWKTLNVH
ncbi:conserved hypothetical protein [Candidatus Nitrotoga sp. HW29]|nr:conserved hypothetical protein [Candidatus Nitrotoga sp. HW29]